MRSVQDSVLPEGCGGEASPHISPNPLIHSEPRERNLQGEARNPQGEARNPQGEARNPLIHRAAGP